MVEQALWKVREQYASILGVHVHVLYMGMWMEGFSQLLGGGIKLCSNVHDIIQPLPKVKCFSLR